jgi:hypothetical protein
MIAVTTMTVRSTAAASPQLSEQDANFAIEAEYRPSKRPR